MYNNKRIGYKEVCQRGGFLFVACVGDWIQNESEMPCSMYYTFIAYVWNATATILLSVCVYVCMCLYHFSLGYLLFTYKFDRPVRMPAEKLRFAIAHTVLFAVKLLSKVNFTNESIHTHTTVTPAFRTHTTCLRFTLLFSPSFRSLLIHSEQ